MKEKKLPVMGTELDGRQRERGFVRTTAGGKPPKRRWQPGQLVELEGELYIIVYCYRLQEDPREWVYCLEERESVEHKPDALLDALENVLGCGSMTPRISYDLFRNWQDAFQFFADIPRRGDSRHVRNKQMVKARLVSSGVIEQKEKP